MAAGQFGTDLDPVVDDQRRILQIVARLLLGVGLAEIARDETEQNNLLAAARTGDDLRADQRQRVMLQIIGESLALRRIDRAAGDSARAGRRRQRAGIEGGRGPDRGALRRTGGAVRVLCGRHARGQTRESDREPADGKGICDATHQPEYSPVATHLTIRRISVNFVSFRDLRFAMRECDTHCARRGCAEAALFRWHARCNVQSDVNSTSKITIRSRKKLPRRRSKRRSRD